MERDICTPCFPFKPFSISLSLHCPLFLTKQAPSSPPTRWSKIFRTIPQRTESNSSKFWLQLCSIACQKFSRSFEIHHMLIPSICTISPFHCITSLHPPTAATCSRRWYSFICLETKQPLTLYSATNHILKLWQILCVYTCPTNHLGVLTKNNSSLNLVVNSIMVPFLNT